MLLKEKKPISDSLLERLLKHLSPQELIQLGIVLSGKNLNPTLSNSSTVWAGSSAWQSARLASEKVLNSHITSDGHGLYNGGYMSGYMGYGGSVSLFMRGLFDVRVPLSEDLLSRFAEWYGRRVRRNTLRYTLKYVREFGWLLNSDKITFMKTVEGDSRRPYILDALSTYCKFLDTVFNTEVFTAKFNMLKRGVMRGKESSRKFTGQAPTLEQLEKFYSALLSYGYTPAVELFRTMLFAGVRTGEARLIVRLLGKGKYHIYNTGVVVVWVWKTNKRKNLYFTLIPLELYGTLRKRKGLGKKYEVQKAWKHAREETGLTELTPYSLRDFHATWLKAHGWPKEDVDLLQGRADKSVLEEHYLDFKNPQSPYMQYLATKYRQAMQPLIPKFLR